LANQTDFLDLYEKLGLNPDCGLTEFKRVYRRHVATLHPDRPTGAPARAEAADPGTLQDVIAQYGAAMEFHRRHGRLPGAATSPPRFTEPDTPTPHVSSPLLVSADASPHGSPHSRSKLLVLLAVIAICVLLWNAAPMPLTKTLPTQGSADDDGDSPDPAVKPGLSMGMSAEDVRAAEGNPQSIHDNRWEYGRSWVRFDHGKVIDWYNSPLRPLHTTDRPTTTHR
jgi:hypothetical protein